MRSTDVFNGDVKLQGELEVNKDMAPVKLPIRKVPGALKELLQEELDRLEKMVILAKAEVPTDWISAMVVGRKHNRKI